MRKSQAALLLALFCLWAEPAFSQQAGAQQVYCGRSFTVSAGATAITQAVAGVTGQTIAVCGYDINAGAAAGTFQLTVGTGTNCGTNTLNITPAFSLGINGQMTSRLPTAFYSTPIPVPPAAGYSLCYTITGTGPINALVTYHQY
jgi:hypothetical protein